MTLFMFQVLQPDGSVLAGDRRDLLSNKEIWVHLEVIAIQLRGHRDLVLRVSDEDGGIVASSGIASVVESLKRCRKVACPIKDLLASPDQEIGARATCMSIAVLNIPRLDLPDAPFHAPSL